MKQLYKYQQKLVERATNSTALFWDMGLGKTITALEVFKKFKGKVDKLLVLCPLSMMDEWCKEFENQVGGKAMPYKQALKKGCLNECDCIAINYEMVWRVDDYSWVNNKTMIVCDESHRIKNSTSKIGKFMKFLKNKTKYKMCLTGTPQSQGYIDYWNQLYFLDKMDISLTMFKLLYCVYEDKKINGIRFKQLVGYKNTDEFEQTYLSDCEFLKVNRVYDEIIKENRINIDVDNRYRRALKDKVIYFDKNGEVITDRKAITDYLSGLDTETVVNHCCYLDNAGSYRYGLRSLLDSEGKHKWLEDFLLGYDKRVVIFYNYNCELNSLIKICEKLKREYSIYNGSIKDFSNFKNFEDGIALCNYKSGSLGINDLVISNVFVAYSPSDNYIEWEQAKKRIDRAGQEHTPIYYFLESGLESRIYASLKAGRNFDDRIFIEEMESNLIM